MSNVPVNLYSVPVGEKFFFVNSADSYSWTVVAVFRDSHGIEGREIRSDSYYPNKQKLIGDKRVYVRAKRENLAIHNFDE